MTFGHHKHIVFDVQMYRLRSLSVSFARRKWYICECRISFTSNSRYIIMVYESVNEKRIISYKFSRLNIFFVSLHALL